MDFYIIILAAFSIIISSLYLFFIIILLLKKDKPTVEIPDNTEKIKLILSSKESIENIDNIVDAIIKDVVDRYMILNVNFTEDPYLKESAIDELSKYAYGSIKKDISDTLRDTIGLVHNISTEEKFDEFIKLRIKMYILAVVVKTNQTINQ